MSSLSASPQPRVGMSDAPNVAAAGHVSYETIQPWAVIDVINASLASGATERAR
jgi:hypothetical protein